MAMKKRCLIAASLALIIVSTLSVVLAAEEEPRPRPGRGAAAVERRRPRRGGGGQAAEFRQRMFERLKNELDVTEEEWTVIEPKLTKVMKLARETNLRGMRGRGGRRGRQGRGPEESESEQSEIQKAAIALQEAVIKSDTSSDDIKVKLEAFRKAKKQAKQELAKAQDELKESLSVRQEAKLVLRGLLE